MNGFKKKNPCVSGPAQLKSELFEDQLCIQKSNTFSNTFLPYTLGGGAPKMTVIGISPSQATVSKWSR